VCDRRTEKDIGQNELKAIPTILLTAHGIVEVCILKSRQEVEIVQADTLNRSQLAKES
jgi:hypothetical protein